MRSQLNEYLKKMIELKIKDIHFFSAFKLIVSYAKKEINFDQFFEKSIIILNKVMLEVLVIKIQMQ